MSDKVKVIAGLLIVFIILSTPFWFKGKKVDHTPVIAPEAKKAGECVLSKEYMKREHMQILDVWRDTVVREGKRVFTNDKGKSYEMSLSNSCLKCHTNKKEFCDKCHNYASVRPYCWDCHIEEPNEKESK